MTGQQSREQEGCAHPDCEHEGCDGKHLVLSITGRAKINIDFPMYLLDVAAERDEFVKADVGGYSIRARSKVYS